MTVPVLKHEMFWNRILCRGNKSKDLRSAAPQARLEIYTRRSQPASQQIKFNQWETMKNEHRHDQSRANRTCPSGCSLHGVISCAISVFCNFPRRWARPHSGSLPRLEAPTSSPSKLNKISNGVPNRIVNIRDVI